MPNALVEAARRGLDFTRDPHTYSIHPYPPIVGMLNVNMGFADPRIGRSINPAPNTLAGVAQYGVLFKPGV